MTTGLPTAPAGGNHVCATWLVFRKLRPATAFAALVAVAVLVSVSAYGGNAPPEGQSGATVPERPVTQEQLDGRVQTCAFCHGLRGSGVSPSFPLLAGQQKAYLSAQLRAFRDKTRTDPPHASIDMAGMAAGLDDAMIERLAGYYAGQTPLPGSAQDAGDAAAGKAIYEHGVPDQILPCMACHGAAAEGAGPTPRLAGQRRLYLERQLAAFAANTRADGLMHQEAMGLTARQIGDVSAYLAAQSGAATEEPVARLAQVCSSCHEFGGRSVSPAFTFPLLAGQQKAYLSAQIKAFRDKTRADPRARTYMWDVAARLDDAMIERLAAFYAAQTPMSGSTQNRTEVAAGKTIFEHGVPDQILPCIACHGAKAEGAGTTPRLAGQHRLSLERQLAYFAANTRAGGMMHRESMRLTARQIGAVSAYLAAQSEVGRGAPPQTGVVTEEQVARMAQVCSSCHEFDAKGASPTLAFPLLAGQQQAYLSAQLTAFRDKTRTDPRHASIDMAGMAARLDDAMIERLAGYYAGQTPLPGSAQDAGDVAAGKALYEHGVPDQILPCMACHGAAAEGAGPTPRLAGQRRLYLERQLAAFAANTRADGLMHQEAMGLTARQIGAVSAYLAAQSEVGRDAAAQTGVVTEEQVARLAQVCSSCHEFGGRSVSPAFTFPLLAGQQKAYLSAQLKAFRDKSRADPRARTYMWAVAAQLDDAMIERLAAFYAAQTPVSDVAAGKNIYEQGIPGQIPPCLTCHGARAEGAGTTPRLAGQPRLDLERQLASFAANTRANGMMHEESMHLTDQQISDLSAYLAAQ